MPKSTKNILIYIFYVFRLPFSLYEEKLAYAYRKFIIRDFGNPINLIKPYTDLRMLWLFNHIKLQAVIKLSTLTYSFKKKEYCVVSYVMACVTQYGSHMDSARLFTREFNSRVKFHTWLLSHVKYHFTCEKCILRRFICNVMWRNMVHTWTANGSSKRFYI